jgi:hypothetical protein
MAKRLFEVGVMMALGIVGAMVLAEWLTGCGQTYFDADHLIHVNQCLFK